MDLNLTVIAGRLADKPTIRTFESGATLVRLLITVRSEGPPNRIDVIPVVQWNPDLNEIGDMERGSRVWVAGAIQRRFWSEGEHGRHSRVEVVAQEVTIQTEEVRVDE